MAISDELSRIVLPNGLTLLFQQMKHSASMAVGLFVKEGSIAEENSEAGYFHFLEHMLFKDSETRTSKQIASDIERVGGILNGSTSKEYTQYYVVASKSDSKLAFDILSDMVFRPKFLEKDIETEKQVVIEEMRSYEDAPDDFLYDFYFRNLYKGSAYGKDIIGTKESILAIKRPKLKAFYEKHYYPANMVLSVSGNLQWKAVVKLAEDYFSFPNPKGKVPKTKVMGKDSKDKEPKKHFSKNLEKRKIEQISIMLGANGIPRDFHGMTCFQTLSTILGGGMSSRLFQNIRETQGLCYSIYSFPTFYRSTGVFTIFCSTSKDKTEKCVRLLLEELKNLVTSGITKKELEDAKSNQLGSMAIGSELPENRMNNMGLQEIYFGRYFSLQDRMKAVKSITLEDIDKSIQHAFANPTFQLSCIGDISESKFEKIPNQLL